MKALSVNMRIITSITIAMIASGVNALDRSGMFVCTPQKAELKPIIYSFDGEYLIRDNNLQVPFTKVSSLTDNMDLYFAFEPTSLANRKLALRRLLQDESDLITSELDGFTKYCGGSLLYDVTLENYYQYDDIRHDKLQLEPISRLVDILGHLSCRKTIKEDIERYLAPVKDEEYNHVKLTINFENMWVIEERIQYGGTSKKYSNFNDEIAIKYQCKSLGIDVPEVDTSESIVPLASNI